MELTNDGQRISEHPIDLFRAIRFIWFGSMSNGGQIDDGLTNFQAGRNPSRKIA